MQSIKDILAGRPNSSEPADEMQTVKDYIARQYGKTCAVRLDRGALIVSVPSSALASTLRLDQQKIIKACKLKKRLVIRSS
jgi:hypothetical protein